MMKRFLALLLCFALLAAPAAQAAESTVYDGTYTAAYPGFGGDVRAEMTVEDGILTAISLSGPDETEAIGGVVLDELGTDLQDFVGGSPAALSLDVVTGATATSSAAANAVKSLAEQAMDAGQTPDETTVPDGTYAASAEGNSVTTPVRVRATFEGGSITAIDIIDHAETESILATVADRMIPRILEAQSLAVDAITGATASSNAVRQALARIIDENGGNSLDWYAPIEKSGDTVRLEGYDVIVVGLGSAGMAAYASAAESGAKVFGLDSAGKIGGTGTNTSGPMAINPPSKMLEENGGEKWLDEETLIQDWLEYTQGDAREDILRLFVGESGATMDWLIEKYDFSFGPMRSFFHPSGWVVWALYEGDKTRMYTNAVEKAKSLDAVNDYMLELTATGLLLEDNEIKGVHAEYYDGTQYEIYGDSVVLATGGFIGSSEMKLQYLGSDLRVEGMLQDDGAGISMALSAGAATCNIDMPAMVHIAQVKNIIRSDILDADQKAVLTALVLKPDSLIVGQDGRRFMAEDGNIAFDNWKGGGFYYAIYSAQQLDGYRLRGMEIVAEPMFLHQGGKLEPNTPIPTMALIMSVGENYGNVVRGETAEELAEKLGMPGLPREMQKYSQAAQGMGRDAFGKDISLIEPLTTGPFYAIAGAGYYYGTCGGLDIDANMQVLRTDGSPIENLYAAGQDAMGVLFSNKDAYVTYGGAAQGWALTSGRLAGANAAEKFQ